MPRQSAGPRSGGASRAKAVRNLIPPPSFAQPHPDRRGRAAHADTPASDRSAELVNVLQRLIESAAAQEDPPLLLTMPQAARLLGISRASLFRLIEKGELATVHLGRCLRLPRVELEHYVARLLADAGRAGEGDA